MKRLLIPIAFISTLILVGCEPTAEELNEQQKIEQKAHHEQEVREAQIRARPQTGPRDMVVGTITKVFGNVRSGTTPNPGQTGSEHIGASQALYGIHVRTTNNTYVIEFDGNRAYTMASLLRISNQIVFPLRYYIRLGDDTAYLEGYDADVQLFDKNRIAIPCVGGPGAVPTWDQLVEIPSQTKTRLEE